MTPGDPDLARAFETTWPAAEYADAGAFRVGRGYGAGGRVSSARALRQDWDEADIPAVEAIAQMRQSFLELRVAVHGHMTTWDDDEKRALEKALSESQQRFAAALADYEKLAAVSDEADRQMLAAWFAAGEQPVFATERDGSNYILRRIVVDV